MPCMVDILGGLPFSEGKEGVDLGKRNGSWENLEEIREGKLWTG